MAGYQSSACLLKAATAILRPIFNMPQQTAQQKQTCLFVEVAQWCFEVVETLIKSGADISVVRKVSIKVCMYVYTYMALQQYMTVASYICTKTEHCYSLHYNYPCTMSVWANMNRSANFAHS